MLCGVVESDAALGVTWNVQHLKSVGNFKHLVKLTVNQCTTNYSLYSFTMIRPIMHINVRKTRVYTTVNNNSVSLTVR